MSYDHLGSRKIVISPPKAEVPSPEKVPTPKRTDTDDIDELMKRGLLNISRMMAKITEQSNDGDFDRETVQNLKDLMNMLSDLKKREQDLLDNMTDEQLHKLNEKT